MPKDTITLTRDELEKRIASAVTKATERNTPPAFLRSSSSSNRVDLGTAKGKAFAYVRALHMLGNAKGNFEKAANVANHWKEKHRSEVDELLVGVMKSGSMQAQDFASAGIFVDIEDTREVIDFLRAKAVVRNIPGVQVTSFVNGGRKMKRSTSDVSVSWVNEGETPTISDKPAYGEHTMTPKKLGARLAVSNDLLRRSSFDITEDILTKFAGAMSQAEDQAFIRSAGGDNTPKGLFYWCHAGNKFAANGTVNTANINADLNKAMRLIDITDIPEASRAWLMNPRESSYLAGLRDANGNKYFPELANGTLGRNYPVLDSNNIPRNLGGGTESEVYLVNGANIVIADELELLTLVDQNAYKDASGTILSAADRDEVVFRMFHSTDLFVRYDTGLSVVTGVTWGA